MKKRTIALLSILSVLGIGGFATGVAFIVKNASQTTPDNIDNGMILNWGNESNFNEITELVYDAPQYRKIILNEPTIVGTINADAIFYCSLEAQANCSLDGLKIDIAKQKWTDSTTSLKTLDSSNLSYQETITSATTYYLKISITEEAYNQYMQENATTVFGANLRFSYKPVMKA